MTETSPSPAEHRQTHDTWNAPAEVRLVPWEDGELDEIMDLVERSRESQRPWYPDRPESFFTLEGQREERERARELRAADSGYRYGIRLADSGRLVGTIVLNPVARSYFDLGRLGYSVAPDCWSRGVATAAGRLVVSIAFEELRLHRLEASVMPRNGASVRVLEKIGFHHEGRARGSLLIAGRWEDHLRFGMLADDPRP